MAKLLARATARPPRWERTHHPVPAAALHPHSDRRASTMEPVTPVCRGPRAHETVWGRALRNAIWGDHDPEWTAGDNAGDSALRPHDSVAVPRGAPRLERPLDISSSWAGQVHLS